MAIFNTDSDPALPTTWFQAARDRFGRAGEYPLIDEPRSSRMRRCSIYGRGNIVRAEPRHGGIIPAGTHE